MTAEENDTYRYDVFISYSHEDSAWVRDTLMPCLEGEGLRVCIDFRDFEVGAPSLVNMENAVERSRKTLLVLTPNWVSSEWTEFEALLIQTRDPAGRGRRILPLMVQPCELPPRLEVFTYLDLTDPAQFDFQMRRLVAAIRSAPQPPAPARAALAPRPAPSARLRARGFSHERGLAALGEHLAQAAVEIRLSFAVLESRLLDNLQDERLYGTSETIRSERARIVHELNNLALTHLSRSFNELCGAYRGESMHDIAQPALEEPLPAPTLPPTPPPGEAEHLPLVEIVTLSGQRVRGWLINVLQTQARQAIGGVVAMLVLMIAIGAWFWLDISAFLFPAAPAATPPGNEVVIEMDGLVIDASDDRCQEVVCRSSPRIEAQVLDLTGVRLQPDGFSYNWRFDPPDPHNLDRLDSKIYAIIYSVPCDRDSQMITIEVLKNGKTLGVRGICFNIEMSP